MVQLSSRTWLVITGFLLLAVLSSGLMLVAAQGSDGRINVRDHVAGDAVYCVDAYFNPAPNWSDGGIRVLDPHGQELLFASASAIEAAGNPPEGNVLVGSGANAYGPLSLYVRHDTDFQLVGTDEWGKAFDFVWGGCGYTVEAPVTPAPTPQPTPDCTEPERVALSPAAAVDPCSEG